MSIIEQFQSSGVTLPQGADCFGFQADLVHIRCGKALVPWLRPSHSLQLDIFPSKISNEEKKVAH